MKTWIRGAMRRRGWLALALWSVFGVLWLTLEGGAPRRAMAQPAAPVAAALPGVPLGTEHAVGPGTVVDNLTVFPIYAKTPEDLGEFTTLEAATAAKSVAIREVGPSEAMAISSAGAGPQAQRQGPQQGLPLQQSGGGDRARVDTVVIENKGKLPILVLAGTIVKGGKQDRQIGEDFVVAPGKTVDVAAFCVEQGRWDGAREGKSTGGQFVAQKSLALGSVRAAGQYDKNQSQVWSEVGKVNAANKKSSASGTLMATMDDAQIAARRTGIANQVGKAIGTAPQQDKVVGVAYTVDGQVKGVRWFAGPKLFQLHRETLLHTAAMEAIAASAGRAPGAAVPPPGKAEAVAAFVTDMEKEAVAERKAKADDAVSLKKSAKGYASETFLMVDDPKAAPGRAAPKAPKSLSKDFVKK